MRTAIRSTRSAPGRQRGPARSPQAARAGFTLIELMIAIAIAIIGVLAALTVPYLSSARMRSNESAAISHLRTLTTAQNDFHERDADKNGVFDYAPSLADLYTHGGLIDENLADGAHSGYLYRILPGVTP